MESNAEKALTRREAIGRTAAAFASVWISGCLRQTTTGPEDPIVEGPRLTARPSTPTGTGPTGRQAFPLAVRRVLIFVPSTYSPANPLPLALLLHGSAGAAEDLMDPYQTEAERLGMILVAPECGATTWDALTYKFSYDVNSINSALDYTFKRYAVDSAKVSIVGFSDGATYALGLGRANGDFVSRIVAHSPGYLLPIDTLGRPRIFQTHGTTDTVLGIESTSRQIVPALRNEGYTVDYREFEGGHGVPLSLLKEAADWMAA
ncbi:MAG: phospholipase [Gemmatimonadales bacterium]|nr:phospholipase [Gemmatimonadales bacterium]